MKVVIKFQWIMFRRHLMLLETEIKKTMFQSTYLKLKYSSQKHIPIVGDKYTFDHILFLGAIYLIKDTYIYIFKCYINKHQNTVYTLHRHLKDIKRVSLIGGQSCSSHKFHSLFCKRSHVLQIHLEGYYFCTCLKHKKRTKATTRAPTEIQWPRQLMIRAILQCIGYFLCGENITRSTSKSRQIHLQKISIIHTNGNVKHFDDKLHTLADWISKNK